MTTKLNLVHQVGPSVSVPHLDSVKLHKKSCVVLLLLFVFVKCPFRLSLYVNRLFV